MDRKSAGAALNALMAVLVLAWTSCKGTDTVPQLPLTVNGRAVLIGCEGSLGIGNASLTLYKPDGDSVFDNAFQAANGTALGDVLQSITLAGGKLLLAVNNSDRLVAVDPGTLKELGSVSVPKPRYVLQVGPDKAFVSAIYDNKIHLLDLGSLQLTGQIQLPHQNPEGMLLHGGKAYVACWDTACRALYELDAATGAVSRTLPLPGAAPQSIAADAEGKLWVLTGNVYKGKNAHLTRIDPATAAVLADYAFPPGADAMRLCTNAAKDSLYFLEVDYNGGTTANGLFRMNIHSPTLPQTAFVAAQPLQYFWGVDIEPGTGLIYLADPKGFTQRGAVRVYDPQGQLRKTIATGIGPGHFYFQP